MNDLCLRCDALFGKCKPLAGARCESPSPPIDKMAADGWIEWRGGVCPVSPMTRVEVVQELRHARGLALSFDWVQKIGPRAVFWWRHERPVR